MTAHLYSLTDKDKVSRLIMGVLCYGPKYGLSMEAFLSDFYWVTGYDFPFRELGYPDLVSCLDSAFDDITIVQRYGRNYCIFKKKDHCVEASHRNVDGFDWYD